MKHKFVKPQAVILALGTTLCTVALATPPIQNQFKAGCKLKPATALTRAGCKSCHTSAPELNPFGTDMQAEMTKQKAKAFTSAVWAKLASRDSDKDGISNQKEIAAGTLPGDAKSKP